MHFIDTALKFDECSDIRGGIVDSFNLTSTIPDRCRIFKFPELLEITCTDTRSYSYLFIFFFLLLPSQNVHLPVILILSYKDLTSTIIIQLYLVLSLLYVIDS